MKTECPYCGKTAEAEFVDIGVGNLQCGPYGCPNCQAVEIGPNDKVDWEKRTAFEKHTGWYEPTKMTREEVSTMALKIAAKTFRGYEKMHLAKGPEAKGKAEQNAGWARMMEEALERVTIF